MFADVTLPVPFESFTYLVPPALEPQVGVGVRVVVPFGQSKKYVGLVLSVHGNEPQGVTVKEIETVLDASPIVTSQQLDFKYAVD